MRRLGQHFLNDRSILQKIADEAVKTSSQIIIEIGPGHGELTGALIDARFEMRDGERPIRIIAIEKDPKLIVQLREKFKDFSNIEIIEGDIRKILPAINSHLPPRTSYTLIGNIPYYLTGYLFRLIGELEEKPETCVFMIQKEVAVRLAAKPPFMNRLAAAVQYWAEVKILLHVGRNDFSPPPKVDSALIRLTPRPPKNKKLMKRYFALVQRLFAAPRKTIMNNLAGKMEAGPRAKFENEVRNCGIDPIMRPQNLNVEEIDTLAEHLIDES
jgi:16S rRNA (adenine1518-N6/adenine1519-N6)-dimethyltransferase